MFTVDEYKTGLEGAEIKVGSFQYNMLRAQYSEPNHRVSTPKLAEHLGLVSHGAINLNYGKLARVICSVIGKSPPASSNGKIYWFEALSEFSKGDDCFYWTMYPNFAKALEELNIV